MGPFCLPLIVARTFLLVGLGFLFMSRRFRRLPSHGSGNGFRNLRRGQRQRKIFKIVLKDIIQPTTIPPRHFLLKGFSFCILDHCLVHMLLQLLPFFVGEQRGLEVLQQVVLEQVLPDKDKSLTGYSRGCIHTRGTRTKQPTAGASCGG